MTLHCEFVTPKPSERIKLWPLAMTVTGLLLMITSWNQYSFAQDAKAIMDGPLERTADLTLDASEIVSRTEAHLAALEKRDIQIANLAHMVDELIGLLGETRSTNVTRRGRIDTLAQRLIDSETTRKEIEHQLLSLQTERAQSSAQISILQDVINDDVKKIRSQGIRLTQAKYKAQSQNQEIRTLRSSLYKLNLKVKRLQKNKTILERDLKSVRADAKVQSAKLTRLTQNLIESSANEILLLARHQAEFFSLLREALGPRTDSRVVNDRFVFQSESLFTRGSSTLKTQGKTQLTKLADTFTGFAPTMPNDLGWVLRIDAHTDQDPTQIANTHADWELSTGRAIAIVQFLIGKGIEPKRLVAAGFGQHHPTDKRKDEIAQRRNRRIEVGLTYP